MCLFWLRWVIFYSDQSRASIISCGEKCTQRIHFKIYPRNQSSRDYGGREKSVHGRYSYRNPCSLLYKKNTKLRIKNHNRFKNDIFDLWITNYGEKQCLSLPQWAGFTILTQSSMIIARFWKTYFEIRFNRISDKLR